jgi:hypothetical protein
MKDLPNGHKARLDAEDRLYARLKGRLLNKRRMELDMTQVEVADESSANGVRGCNGTALGRKMWLGGGGRLRSLSGSGNFRGRNPVVSLRSTDRLMAFKPLAWDEGTWGLRCGDNETMRLGDWEM